MSTENIAKLKLKNIQDRIDAILDSDVTPFDSVPEALEGLSDAIGGLSNILQRAISTNDEQLIISASENINKKILHSLPIIGLILRSTNVRNAFELVDPLQSLSRKFLGEKSSLILSSEWDYIPFAYPQTLEDFPTFTLIGLPASEGSNILILPLAGHELGHSVWSHEELDEDLYDELMDLIEQEYSLNIAEFGISVPEYYKAGLEDDLVLEDCKQNTIEYAMKHAEEIFCDLFGLLLFGESYLRAFVYILAPSMGTRRSSDYPPNERRAKILQDYAEGKFSFSTPYIFSNLFTQKSASWSPRHAFIMKIADICVNKFIDTIWKAAENITKKSGIERPDSSRRDGLIKKFRNKIPSSRVYCVGDVVNAAWACFDEISDEAARKKLPFEEFQKRIELLNEMSLKTIEALEFRQRLERP